ncbi:MAG: cell division protein FtsZ, partial [Pseudomonadota bacterium]
MVRVSVVATGMDGASIAAIEPYQQRRREAEAQRAAETALDGFPVPRFEEPEAVAAAQEMAEDVRPAEPEFSEPPPIAANAPAPSRQPGLFLDSLSAPPAPNLQPIARIVDPSVADEEDEPLFAPAHYDDRRQKGGWLSLFGRPRQEAVGGAPAPARSAGGAQPALEPFEEHEAEERDDLEIPSFLRRLAN